MFMIVGVKNSPALNVYLQYFNFTNARKIYTSHAVQVMAYYSHRYFMTTWIHLDICIVYALLAQKLFTL